MRRATAKSAAQVAARRAQRAGRIGRPTRCEACLREGPVRLHHHSYAREHWEDVIPLCASCHTAVHMGRRPEPRTGRVYPAAEPTHLTELGAMLARLRTAAGLSVPDVVEATGVPRSTAYAWERYGRPEPHHLGRLLDLYRATDEDRLEAWRLRSTPPDADARSDA